MSTSLILMLFPPPSASKHSAEVGVFFALAPEFCFCFFSLLLCSFSLHRPRHLLCLPKGGMTFQNLLSGEHSHSLHLSKFHLFNKHSSVDLPLHPKRHCSLPNVPPVHGPLKAPHYAFLFIPRCYSKI